MHLYGFILKPNRLQFIMIKSFKHKGLKRYFETGSTSGLQTGHEPKIRRILSVLDNATVVQDMNLPSYRLHRLSGNRKDIWSVWINGNWRITFRFTGGDAEIINYEDYH